MSRADSIRHTASIARCVSDSGHRPAPGRVARPRHGTATSPSPPPARAGAAPAPELGGSRRELRDLVDLAQLDLDAAAERRAPHPRDRFLLRPHLDQPEARDQLLRFGERPVRHRDLPVGELEPRALGRRVQPFAGEHHARLHHLFVELPHRGEDLLVRENARLGLLAGRYHDHEAHCRVSLVCRVRRASVHLMRRTRSAGIDTPPSARLVPGRQRARNVMCGLRFVEDRPAAPVFGSGSPPRPTDPAAATRPCRPAAARPSPARRSIRRSRNSRGR